jgi:hypothetical protein
MSHSALMMCVIERQRQKRKREVEVSLQIKDLFFSAETLPSDLLKPLKMSSFKQFKKFVAASSAYAFRSNESARSLIADLQPGYKHHSLHCVSIVDSFKSLCGFSLPELGNLMASLKSALAEQFPKCPETLNEGESHVYCSRIMKLFMVLYRCRLGSPFLKIESTFGWCDSMLDTDFTKIVYTIATKMRRFNTGFLEYTGPNWQHTQLRLWQAKHICFQHDYEALWKVLCGRCCSFW